MPCTKDCRFFLCRVVVSSVFIVVMGSTAASQSFSTTMTAQSASFEVASVKPSPPDFRGEDWDSAGERVLIRGYSLLKLIKAAYHLKSDSEIVGGPDWIDKKYFDISAAIGATEMALAQKAGSEPDVAMMLQTLLQERFKLKVEAAHKELPVFALVIASKKLHLVPDNNKTRSLSINGGQLIAAATSLQEFAESLSHMREVNDRSVLDRTGLSGRYDFALNWTPDRGAGVPAEATLPGLFTALHEQLGLELKPAKGDVPVVKVLTAELPVAD